MMGPSHFSKLSWKVPTSACKESELGWKAKGSVSPPVPVPWAAHGAGGAAAAAPQELPPPGESRNDKAISVERVIAGQVLGISLR